MLNRIIQFSIKNKLIIGLFTLSLIGYGAYEVTKLPIDAVPDITNNQVQIITSAPSLAAPEIERLITFPIEQANNNIPGIKEIRSFTRFGLSVVTIVFDDATDLYWARQQVSERLQLIQDQIPKGFGSPKLAPVTTGLGEIYQYTIRAKKGYENKYTPTELRTIQDWIVRRQLLNVKGVAEVSSFGGYLKQFEIAVDPAKLKSYNTTINDVFTALEQNNQNTGGAYIERGPTLLYIRSEGLVGNFNDIENIVVKNLANGTPLLIRNIGEVKEGYATRYGAMTYNGTAEVSGAVVMMLKGANSKEVIQNIKSRVKEIQKTLPEGIILDPFLDRTKMVNNSINTVTKNLMEGALIVIFVLVLFLGNFRAGILVASVIPLSMLFTVIMMNIFKVSGNLMSLGALDFGLIVDGAVIVVEAVMHRLTHSKHFDRLNRLSQQEMDTEVQNSASKMMNSAVFGQIIILIVYLPIFTLEGIEGKMFKPMAQTVAFALVGAFILSLTYIPMMSSLFLSKTISHKKTFSDKMMEKIERFYQHALEKILNFPKLVLGSAITLFAISILILTTLGGEFIPSLPEGDFAVETRVLPGSNLKTSTDAISKASKLLLANFPEVEKVVGKTGSSEVPTDPMPIDASDMMIILKPRAQWTSAKTYEELELKMSETLKQIPGVMFGFQYPVAMRFNELISGARQDVVCKIYGENLDTLAYYANKLGDICNTVQGSSGLYVETVTGLPQIVIKYNRGAMAEFGLNINDVNRVVNTAFAGQSSGLVHEGEKRFDMVVRLAGEKRKDLSDVQQLLIPTSKGTQIPLYQVASVSVEEGPNQIQRENTQRRIIVGFNVRGRDIQSMVTELQQKTEAQIKLPVGYHITYGGAFENLEAAKKRLQIAVPVSLLLIFLMLYFAFSSVKQGLLIYSAIPLSAIGGILALATRGIPFSISAGIGFIALFGVAVLNGIVLVAEFNRLRAEGTKDLKRVVVQGTKIRLRPVLMTAFVASLGFLPMALSHGEGAEVQRPLATVVIGGLLVATFLTLFVLPILYIMFEKKIAFKTKPIAANAILVLMTSISLLVFSQNTQAQISTKPAYSYISLGNAIDSAIKNNLNLKNERSKAAIQQTLIKSGNTISQTMLSADYGQINSFYKDSKFGISQNFNFPTIYSNQKSLLKNEWKASEIGVNLKTAELKRNVAELFYTAVYLHQKRNLLEKTDSLQKEFLNKTVQRFNKGEADILEKTTAENLSGQISMQLGLVTKDLDLILMQFNHLLNSTTYLQPDLNSVKLPLDNPSSVANNTEENSLSHPYLAQLKQQELVASAQTNVEKSKLLPDLSLNYNITSIQGVGADNKNYSSTPQFHSAQIGLGIPLFTSGQRSKIQAAKQNEKLKASEFQAGQIAYETEYKKAILSYKQCLSTVDLFEKNLLNNANLLEKSATKKFNTGEINYLEWIMLLNQSMAIQNNYIDAIKNLNESTTLLNYLTSK